MGGMAQVQCKHGRLQPECKDCRIAALERENAELREGWGLDHCGEFHGHDFNTICQATKDMIESEVSEARAALKGGGGK